VTDDRLRDALTGMQPSVDPGTVESALDVLHHRSARRRRQRRALGGLASIAVLAGALAIVAALGPGGDDAQQVIADQPDTTTTETTTTVGPPPEATSTTAETIPPPTVPDRLTTDELGQVVGIELRTWFFDDDVDGFWSAPPGLVEQVVAALADQDAPFPEPEVSDRATLRFELADGSYRYRAIDVESGWVEPSQRLPEDLTRQIRAGLNDAVANPWEDVDLDNPDAADSHLAEVLAGAGFPVRDLAPAPAVLQQSLEAHPWWEGDHWFIDVQIEGHGPKVEIRERGLGDDSVRGVDYVISLVDTPDGWGVDGAMSRYLCMRGVPSGPDYLCI
jgi:hypothetical protein